MSYEESEARWSRRTDRCKGWVAIQQLTWPPHQCMRRAVREGYCRAHHPDKKPSQTQIDRAIAVLKRAGYSIRMEHDS